MPKETWPGMPATTHRAILDYLRHLANCMGLADWTVFLRSLPLGQDPDPEDDIEMAHKAAASARCLDGRRVVNITLNREFATYPPEDQRLYLTHELVHVHLWQIHAHAHDTLSEAVGAHAWNVYEPAMMTNVELATDAISTAWSDTLPLPSETTTKPAS